MRGFIPSFFKNSRVWVGPRLTPVRSSILAAASAEVAGGCARKYSSSLLLLFDQLAFRAVKVQLLELLHSPRLILVQVAIESGFGDTAQLLDLFILQLLAPQVDYFHLPLHVWVRMVESPIAQRASTSSVLNSSLGI